jgi:integrase
VLTDAEVRAVWHADVPWPWQQLVRMLLLTGARRTEVSEARWSELNGDLWIIPPERYKTGATHVVPIVPALRRLLDDLPRWQHNDWLFGRRLSGFSHGKAMVDRASCVTGFTLHDLRRTMRTHLSALPVSDLVRELVIGHARPGLHRIYDQHSYVDEKREALTLWAERLLRIVGKVGEI